MYIDLARSLYSHCEHAVNALPTSYAALQELLVQRLVGAPIRVTRTVTYLQGAVTLLEHDHEFRLHVWVDLPEGHPAFPDADRGLACLVRPISREGLLGPTVGGVGWLGRPLGEWQHLEDNEDWVTEMVRDQGYLSIPGAEWMEPVHDVTGQALLGWWLGRHLDGMTNHVILEEQLLRR